jgi:hypothetical protein
MPRVRARLKRRRTATSAWLMALWPPSHVLVVVSLAIVVVLVVAAVFQPVPYERYTHPSLSWHVVTQ